MRKLLELERAQQELTGQAGKAESGETTGKIACEKCGDKIPMHIFVDHIRLVFMLRYSNKEIYQLHPTQKSHYLYECTYSEFILLTK